MKERAKKRIWEFIGGSILLSLGVGDWIIAVRQNFRLSSSSLFAGTEINQPLFYLFHIGAIVIGVGTICMALRPEKYVQRYCPTCRGVTQQLRSGTKYSQIHDLTYMTLEREWICESCRKKNTEPWQTRKRGYPKNSLPVTSN
jgi:hypothetical protein